jgi:PIN domain nuclease of toxin-antitoxin system
VKFLVDSNVLVAQAMQEGLTILTADSDIPEYDAPVIWK